MQHSAALGSLGGLERFRSELEDVCVWERQFGAGFKGPVIFETEFGKLLRLARRSPEGGLKLVLIQSQSSPSRKTDQRKTKTSEG